MDEDGALERTQMEGKYVNGINVNYASSYHTISAQRYGGSWPKVSNKIYLPIESIHCF